MTLTLAQKKPIIELSYSSWSTLRGCARRYQLLKRFKHPKYAWENGLPAVGGSAVHSYIQSRCIGESHEKASYEFFKSFNFEVEAMDSDYNRKFRAMEDCYASAINAYEKLQITPDEVAKITVGDEDRFCIEVAFNIIISSPKFENDYHFRGFIDIVKFQSFGSVYSVGDFKTQRSTQEADETVDLSHVYRYDDQLIPYGLVIAALEQHKRGDFSTDGTQLIEKIPNFKTHFYSIYIDVVNSFLKEYTFNRTKDDVKGWLQKLIIDISAIESYHTQEVWPRTHNGCSFFFKPCRFFKNCEVEDHEIMQDLLLNNHEPAPPKPVVPWVTINLEV